MLAPARLLHAVMGNEASSKLYASLAARQDRHSLWGPAGIVCWHCHPWHLCQCSGQQAVTCWPQMRCLGAFLCQMWQLLVTALPLHPVRGLSAPLACSLAKALVMTSELTLT